MVDTPGRKGVRIKVTADTAKARADISKLNGTFRNVESSAARAATNIKRIAVSLGTIFAGGAATRGINRATDGLVDMENQVALVVGRTEKLQKQMNAIYEISRKTKAPVASTAEAFSRLGRAMSDSGASIEDINKAVTTLNKAATISGGAVESQRAAMFQLGQGLSAGTLRGEELNSVMEQLPRVAKALADELGVGLGGLRELSQEGQLTTDVVFNAMLNQAERVNDEFGNIQLTSSKAMVLLIDQVKRLTADISKATGFTDTFTQKIVSLTDYIAGNRTSIVSSVVEARNKIRELVGGFKELADINVARTFALDLFSSVRSLAQQYLGDAEDYIRTWSQKIIDHFFVIYDEVIGNSWWTDTVIETFDLAKNYLGKTEGVVSEFANSVMGKFKQIYGSVGTGIQFDISTSVSALSGLKDNIIDTVAQGIRKGADALTLIAPQVRKAMEVALTGAFVAVFSTGSITKSLTKIANKIGPLLFVGLAAKLVEAVGSPSVFAAFGFLAGEFVGQIANGLISATPDIVAGLISGIGGGIYGLLSEAGIVGGTAFAVTAGLILSKTLRGVAINMAKSFGQGTGFGGSGGFLIDLFDKKKRESRFKSMGADFRNFTFSSVFLLNDAMGELAVRSSKAAAANNLSLVPSIDRVGKAAKFARLRTLGLAAAITLAATSAFAGTGEGGVGGGFTELALLIGSSLIGPELLRSVGTGFKLLGRTAAGAMVTGFITSIGSMIASAAAGIVALIAAPITLAIGAVVAAGGLAYVMLFGEGDTFMDKVRDVIDDVKAEFNLLNVSTFDAAKGFRKSVSKLGDRGQLANNRFLNNRVEDRLKNLNFVSLDDKNARELVSLTSKLEQLSQRAAQEQSRYNQVSEGTRKEMLAVQKALLEATQAAEASQAPVGETFKASLEKAIANQQGAADLTAEAITSALLPFLLSDESRQRENLRDLIQGNNLETMDDIRTLVENLAISDPQQLQQIIGKNIADALISLRDQGIDRESMDAFTALVAAQSTGEEKLVARALKDFNDTVADHPRRFREEVMDRSMETLKNFRDGLTNQELAQIDDGELLGITKLIKLLKGAERQLEAAVNDRTKYSSEDRELRAQRVQSLEAQIALAFERALETGMQNTDFSQLTNRLLDAGLDEGLASRISFASQTDDLGILSGALKDVERQIEDIETGSVKWSKATERQLALLRMTKQSLTDQFTTIAQIKEIQDVKPEEVEGLLSEAIAISGLDIDLDKLFKVDPDTRKEIAELAASVMALRVAANANTSEALAAAGASSNADAIAQIEASAARIQSMFKGLGGSITKGLGSGAKAMTDFERLVQGTGLALRDAVALGATEATKIVSALKSIENAEKNINKLALQNVEARRAQLALIEKQRDVIRDTLIAGTVGQAQAGLSSMGIDGEVAFGGPEAIEAALRLNELYQERNSLDVSNVEAIKAKTREIERQEELLRNITEGQNSMKERFAQTLHSGISDVLKGGSLKDAFYSLLDNLTDSIIDSFSKGITDAIMNSEMMTGLFDNILNPDVFKDLGESLTKMVSGLFGGGEGGGLLKLLGGFFGGFKFFDSGGTVPFIPGAQHGKDSVPAMLKPGERVLSKNDIRNGQRGAKGGGGNSTFNIEVTGDVTRQTRREIMDMIPQIAQGVNAENRELNYQYR